MKRSYNGMVVHYEASDYEHARYSFEDLKKRDQATIDAAIESERKQRAERERAAMPVVSRQTVVDRRDVIIPCSSGAQSVD